MKNMARNLNLDWNGNYRYEEQDFFDAETLKKTLIIIGAGCLIGVLLAVMFAGFLYGIQQNTVDQEKLSYGKLFLIIIAPCILLGLIAGILLL